MSYRVQVRGLSARVAAIVAVLFTPVAASGDATRVAVVDGDPTLIDALITTLDAWQIQVVSVSGSGFVDMAAARRLAIDADAGAVVWVSQLGGEHVLWVYDTRDEQVVARRIISPPPFDEPTAASVALSVKTLLRHSAVAPSKERFGAVDPKESPFVFDEQPSVNDDPTSMFIEVTGGARFRSIGSSDIEPTFGVALFWSPRALSGRYGAVLGVRGGPGVALDTAELIGSYRDTAGFVGLGVRLPVRGRFSLAWSLAAEIHYTQLDGLIGAVQQTASESRINPAIRGHLGVSAKVGDTAIELGADSERWLRGQRYTVLGEPVLETPASAYSIVLALMVPFR